MGPPPAEGMLRELMAMGADDGYLVSAREFGGSDTYATSQILAAALDTIGLDDDDIVFCGVRLSMVIPLRSVLRSLRSCTCPRSPTPPM